MPHPMVVAALAATLAAPALGAQSHPLLGTWAVTVPGGAKFENGVVTRMTAKATLVIESVGDSLIATLTSEPIEDRPPSPPTRFAGKREAGDAVLVNRGMATMTTNNGEPQSTPIVSTMQLKAIGDSLAGTIERQLEGVDLRAAGGKQPINGTRKK